MIRFALSLTLLMGCFSLYGDEEAKSKEMECPCGCKCGPECACGCGPEKSCDCES